MAARTWRACWTVSILARPEGRALHGDLCTSGLDTEVSILARPEGRALHGLYPDPQRAHAVSILARPEVRALRRRGTLASSLFMFQSSPAPKDGRYWGEWRQGSDAK